MPDVPRLRPSNPYDERAYVQSIPNVPRLRPRPHMSGNISDVGALVIGPETEGRFPQTATLIQKSGDQGTVALVALTDEEERRGVQNVGSNSPELWPKLVRTYPNGVLHAYIYYHSLSTEKYGIIRCWTYVSQGLSNIGQKEIVYTVKQRDTEQPLEYPQAPLRFLESVHTLVMQGLAADEFGFLYIHVLRGNLPLGPADFRRIIYSFPLPIQGVPENALPPNRLHAIAITKNEVDIVEKYGSTRVLAHLGFSEGCFPFPGWIDRDRKDCISLNALKGSVLDGMSPGFIAGISAYESGSKIVLHVSRHATAQFISDVQRIKDTDGLVLTSFHHSEANACYFWERGNVAPKLFAMHPPLHCKSFCFIAFGLHPEANNWLIIEDGCGGKNPLPLNC